jgi:diadenosine tetraphosphatase ApaH/serine/threonine PP2A family protein phosphatase
MAEVGDFDPDLVVVGGDVVPGPMPRACLRALMANGRPTRFIRGNGETDVVAFFDGSTPERVPQAFRPTLQWVADRLDRGSRDSMAAWPLTVSARIEGLGEVLFCHATPRHDNELFTVRTPAEALAPVVGASGADVVVCGHTHMQFDRDVAGTRVVNAGSVGLPFGDTAAGWLTLEPGRIELRRTAYDLDAAMRSIVQTGYPIPVDLADPPSAHSMVEAFEARALGEG